MAFQGDTWNCGLQILQGLSGIADSRTGKINEMYFYRLLGQFLTGPAMGLCNFSDNVDNHDNSNGRILAKIIRDNNLGEIVAGPVAPNPIHSNQTHIQSWSWAVNKKSLKKYLEENEPQEIKEEKARAEKAKIEAEEKKRAKELKEQEYAKSVIEEFKPTKPLTPAQTAQEKFDPLQYEYVFVAGSPFR